jgi:NAD(P)-dependent dehydrogenase (short-subunit alcohol dehydrogenase family)
MIVCVSENALSRSSSLGREVAHRLLERGADAILGDVQRSLDRSSGGMGAREG